MYITSGYCDREIQKKPQHPGGTVLVSLEERVMDDIRIHELPVAIRHLKTNRRPWMFQKLGKVIRSLRDAYFPADKEFAESFFQGRLENKAPDSYDYFFCSELVAYSLMHLGILANNHVPNY